MADERRIGVARAGPTSRPPRRSSCARTVTRGTVGRSAWKAAPRSRSSRRGQEILFFCAWPAEASAAGQAARYRSQGFANAWALRGGVTAWQQAAWRGGARSSLRDRRPL